MALQHPRPPRAAGRAPALLPLIRTALFLAAAAVLGACDAPGRRSSRVAGPDSAEYAVWSAALRSAVLEPRDRMVALMDSTWAVPAPLDDADRYGRQMLRDSFPAAEGLFSRFDALNGRRHALRPAFSIPREYRLLSDTEMKAFFGLAPDGNWRDVRDREAGWLRFDRRFPGSAGVIRLSRVALSADGRWALMYFDVQCGDTCGGGNYLGLRREAGMWRVVANVNLWVS